MGLLYMMPVSEEETDRLDHKDINGLKSITLKSYGLPMIFWGYLAAILTVVAAMHLGISSPIERLAATGDSINILLARGVQAFIYVAPAILVSCYFYEKSLVKFDKTLIVKHKVFWIPVLWKTIHLDSKESLVVDHFMDSPNVAKMRGQQDMKVFENKGYFELHAKNNNGEMVFLDRHSRKADMVKIKELLSKY